MTKSKRAYDNILVLDTATEACSVAIQTKTKVYHHFEVCPQQQSQRILPMIIDVCEQAGISIQQVDAIGFGQGPGSFTGVRIAIGTVQGLALGLELPVVGVSTLAAMAEQVLVEQSGATDILVAIDARMSEVYFAHYRRTSTNAFELIEEERVISPEVAAAYADNYQHAAHAGTGWEAYPALQAMLQNGTTPTVTLPNARYMLQRTEAKLSSGQFDSAETAMPVYLRDTVTWKKLPGRD